VVGLTNVASIIKKGADNCIAVKGKHVNASGESEQQTPLGQDRYRRTGSRKTCIGMIVRTKGLAEYHELPA
jgi:hypothetical protein